MSDKSTRPRVTNERFDPRRMLEKAKARAYPSAQSDRAGEVAYWTERVKAERERDNAATQNL